MNKFKQLHVFIVFIEELVLIVLHNLTLQKSTRFT